MALFKSQVLTQASGSVGGLTYAHNAGGMYMRARSVPTNPNTSFQALARTGLTYAVNAWTEALDQLARDSWELYAANVPMANRLGDERTVSGQNMFIRSQSVGYMNPTKLGLSVSQFNMAPEIFNLGDFTTPTVDTVDSGTGIVINLSGTGWRQEANSRMFLYMGRPMNAGRNYFRGPWRLIGAATGAGTPPTTISVAENLVAARGWPLFEGNVINLVVQVLRGDGRLSSRRNLGLHTVTAE